MSSRDDDEIEDWAAERILDGINDELIEKVWENLPKNIKKSINDSDPKEAVVNRMRTIGKKVPKFSSYSIPAIPSSSSEFDVDKILEKADNYIKDIGTSELSLPLNSWKAPSRNYRDQAYSKTMRHITPPIIDYTKNMQKHQPVYGDKYHATKVKNPPKPPPCIKDPLQLPQICFDLVQKARIHEIFEPKFQNYSKAISKQLAEIDKYSVKLEQCMNQKNALVTSMAKLHGKALSVSNVVHQMESDITKIKLQVCGSYALKTSENHAPCGKGIICKMIDLQQKLEKVRSRAMLKGCFVDMCQAAESRIQTENIILKKDIRRAATIATELSCEMQLIRKVVCSIRNKRAVKQAVKPKLLISKNDPDPFVGSNGSCNENSEHNDNVEASSYFSGNESDNGDLTRTYGANCNLDSTESSEFLKQVNDALAERGEKSDEESIVYKRQHRKRAGSESSGASFQATPPISYNANRPSFQESENIASDEEVRMVSFTITTSSGHRSGNSPQAHKPKNENKQLEAATKGRKSKYLAETSTSPGKDRLNRKEAIKRHICDCGKIIQGPYCSCGRKTQKKDLKQQEENVSDAGSAHSCLMQVTTYYNPEDHKTYPTEIPLDSERKKAYIVKPLSPRGPRNQQVKKPLNFTLTNNRFSNATGGILKDKAKKQKCSTKTKYSFQNLKRVCACPGSSKGKPCSCQGCTCEGSSKLYPKTLQNSVSKNNPNKQEFLKPDATIGPYKCPECSCQFSIDTFQSKKKSKQDTKNNNRSSKSKGNKSMSTKRTTSENTLCICFNNKREWLCRCSNSSCESNSSEKTKKLLNISPQISEDMKQNENLIANVCICSEEEDPCECCLNCSCQSIDFFFCGKSRTLKTEIESSTTGLCICLKSDGRQQSICSNCTYDNRAGLEKGNIESGESTAQKKSNEEMAKPSNTYQKETTDIHSYSIQNEAQEMCKCPRNYMKKPCVVVCPSCICQNQTNETQKKQKTSSSITSSADLESDSGSVSRKSSKQSQESEINKQTREGTCICSKYNKSSPCNCANCTCVKTTIERTKSIDVNTKKSLDRSTDSIKRIPNSEKIKKSQKGDLPPSSSENKTEKKYQLPEPSKKYLSKQCLHSATTSSNTCACTSEDCPCKCGSCSCSEFKRNVKKNIDDKIDTTSGDSRSRGKYKLTSEEVLNITSDTDSLATESCTCLVCPYESKKEKPSSSQSSINKSRSREKPTGDDKKGTQSAVDSSKKPLPLSSSKLDHGEAGGKPLSIQLDQDATFLAEKDQDQSRTPKRSKSPTLSEKIHKSSSRPNNAGEKSGTKPTTDFQKSAEYSEWFSKSPSTHETENYQHFESQSGESVVPDKNSENEVDRNLRESESDEKHKNKNSKDSKTLSGESVEKPSGIAHEIVVQKPLTFEDETELKSKISIPDKDLKAEDKCIVPLKSSEEDEGSTYEDVTEKGDGRQHSSREKSKNKIPNVLKEPLNTESSKLSSKPTDRKSSRAPGIPSRDSATSCTLSNSFPKKTSATFLDDKVANKNEIEEKKFSRSSNQLISLQPSTKPNKSSKNQPDSSQTSPADENKSKTETHKQPSITPKHDKTIERNQKPNKIPGKQPSTAPSYNEDVTKTPPKQPHARRSFGENYKTEKSTQAQPDKPSRRSFSKFAKKIQDEGPQASHPSRRPSSVFIEEIRGTPNKPPSKQTTLNPESKTEQVVVLDERSNSSLTNKKPSSKYKKEDINKTPDSKQQKKQPSFYSESKSLKDKPVKTPIPNQNPEQSPERYSGRRSSNAPSIRFERDSAAEPANKEHIDEKPARSQSPSKAPVTPEGKPGRPSSEKAQSGAKATNPQDQLASPSILKVMRDCQDKLRECQGENEQLDFQWRLTATQIQRLQDDLQNCKKSYEDCVAEKISDTSILKQISSLQNEKTRLFQEMNSLEVFANKLEINNDVLKEENEKLRAQLQRNPFEENKASLDCLPFIQKITKLESQIVTISKENEDIVNECADYKVKFFKCREELSKCLAEFTKAPTDISDEIVKPTQNTDCKEWIVLVNKCEAKLKEYRMRSAKSAFFAGISAKQRDNLKAEIDELQTALKIRQQDLRKCLAENATMPLQNQIDMMQRELEKQQVIISQFESSNDQLIRQKEDMVLALEIAEDKLKKSEEEIQKITTESESYVAQQYTKLRIENNHLTAEIDSKNREIGRLNLDLELCNKHWAECKSKLEICQAHSNHITRYSELDISNSKDTKEISKENDKKQNLIHGIIPIDPNTEASRSWSAKKQHGLELEIKEHFRDVKLSKKMYRFLQCELQKVVHKLNRIPCCENVQDELIKIYYAINWIKTRICRCYPDPRELHFIPKCIDGSDPVLHEICLQVVVAGVRSLNLRQLIYLHCTVYKVATEFAKTNCSRFHCKQFYRHGVYDKDKHRKKNKAIKQLKRLETEMDNARKMLCNLKEFCKTQPNSKNPA